MEKIERIAAEEELKKIAGVVYETTGTHSRDGLNLFNKEVLFDLDFIQERLRTKFPELSVERNEIEEYREWQLLPECYDEKGCLAYPLYTFLRIKHIKQLIQKWQYTPTQLKQFTDFEEAILGIAFSTTYVDISDFGFYKVTREVEMERYEQELEDTNSLEDKQELETKIGEIEQELKSFDGKDFEGLQEETRNSIVAVVYYMKIMWESAKISFFFRASGKSLAWFQPKCAYFPQL